MAERFLFKWALDFLHEDVWTCIYPGTSHRLLWSIQAYLLVAAKLFCSPPHLAVPLLTLHPILCPLFSNTSSLDKWQPLMLHLLGAPYNVSVYNIHFSRYTMNVLLTRNRCDLGRQQLKKQMHFCFMIDTDQGIELPRFMNFSGMLKYADPKLFLLLLKKNINCLHCSLLNIMFFAVYAITYFNVYLWYLFILTKWRIV